MVSLKELTADQNPDAKFEQLKKQLVEKIGLKAGEIDKRYEQLTQECGGNKSQARSVLRSEYKGQLRSPAKAYQGIVLASADPFDMFASMKEAAKTAWEADKDNAIKEGLCDEDGNALDTRATWSSGKANPDYGKKLADHAWIRNALVIAQLAGEDDVKAYRMTLNNDVALQDIPQNAGVDFRGNVPDQVEADIMRMNGSTSTRFVEGKIGFSVDDALQSGLIDSIICSAEKLPEWHEQNKDDPRRLVAAIGDVEYIAPEVNSNTGNLHMVIGSENMGFDDPGITCWVPERLLSLINFGSGSKVVVLGRTTQNEYMDELRTMIDVQGVYALPEFKVEPESVQAPVRSEVPSAE